MQSNDEIKARLLGSFLFFTQTFYKLRTGRDFLLSEPECRESHYITISKELTKVFRGQTSKLLINVPPRYGKTELLIHFISWTLARYPDSNFIYVSYSHSLAAKQTKTIREIVTIPEYKNLFNVRLEESSTAKDNFETTQGGCVYAVGAEGSITGRGAGVRGVEGRFSGCIIIDDIIKPQDALSDTVREKVNEWYYDTLLSRLNNSHTPIVFIGQRVHERDLAQQFIDSGHWSSCILPALDEAGNALNPALHTKQNLLLMKEQSPYVFATQYQQEPVPAGGAIFNPDWFIKTDEEPEILASFIFCDTAETDKTYNDATVFSFFGVYKIKDFNRESDVLALHWIDCLEIRVEPCDLCDEFLAFYQSCMIYKCKPRAVVIEKKSTGTYLISVLKEMRGMKVVEIERHAGSGNKASRFLSAQPYVAQRLISLPSHGKHTNQCIDHMRKITSNNSHRFDDIADTAVDAIKLCLEEKRFGRFIDTSEENEVLIKINKQRAHREQLRKSIYG